jgi:hypothetical protein
MLLTPSGMMMASRALQLPNAELPISFTPAGISIELSFSQLWKSEAGMAVKEVGILAISNDLQAPKTLEPIDVILLGKLIEVSFRQL